MDSSYKIYKYYGTGEQDIKSIEIQFNNGEHIFLSNKYIRKIDINLTSVVDVIDDPIFERGFGFSEGCLEINKLILQQMLGTNDLYDKLNYRNGINSLVIHYSNDKYKIKSDIPMILCIYKAKTTPDYMTQLKYEESNRWFIIKWDRVSTL